MRASSSRQLAVSAGTGACAERVGASSGTQVLRVHRPQKTDGTKSTPMHWGCNQQARSSEELALPDQKEQRVALS